MQYTEEELYSMYKTSFIKEDTFIAGLYLLYSSYSEHEFDNKKDFLIEKYDLINFNQVIDSYRSLLNNLEENSFQELYKDINFLKQISIVDLNKIIKLSKSISISENNLLFSSELKHKVVPKLDSLSVTQIQSLVDLFIQKIKDDNLTEKDINTIKNLPRSYSNGFIVTKILFTFRNHSFLINLVELKVTLEEIEKLLRKYNLC
ncbi:hypothetical protein [Arcobacter peruensis]|uniref:hypothetical protein n=1 Tax=Arcobacter peruensis TaxID=2320140 RepID=UPI000F092813|nr:hypothetical protein [Arcobacter peruensis]